MAWVGAAVVEELWRRSDQAPKSVNLQEPLTAELVEIGRHEAENKEAPKEEEKTGEEEEREKEIGRLYSGPRPWPFAMYFHMLQVCGGAGGHSKSTEK